MTRQPSQNPAARGMQYFSRLPAAIPAGKVMVHNSVRPTRRLGSRGFRAFLVAADDDRWQSRIVCDCGFASELGTHYRMPIAG